MRESNPRDEFGWFRDLWHGGFYLGDPLDPMFSPHSVFGYIGIYHAIYLTCIKPYIRPTTVALEIGPGRGAWTRTMLAAREIWCLDALSAEHNGFWEFVGPAPNVTYVQVEDFTCSMLPDDRFDYLFSYDVLCHVSFDGIDSYLRNLRPKLSEGANCFAMVADFEKYSRFVESREARSVANAFVPHFKNPLLRRFLARKSKQLNASSMAPYEAFLEDPEANGWFHAGTDETCALLERHGYRVLDRDIGVDPKSPIIHFTPL